MKYVIAKPTLTRDQTLKKRQVTEEDLFTLTLPGHDIIIERYSKSQCRYFVKGREIPSLRSNRLVMTLVLEIIKLRDTINTKHT